MALVKTCKKPPMSIISASGSICTFNALQEGLPLKSHKVSLTATQSGSGTPSPDNVRTVNGWSAINIGHNSTANIFGGIYLLNAFIKANIYGFSYDTNNKTLRFGAPNVSGKNMYGVFKPNTQYTFYIVGENSTANKNTNIQILYSDGTTTNIQWANALANTKQTRVITSTAGKTVVGLRGGNYAGTTTLYYDECGAIEGVKTIDDFVAFGGTSYLIQIGSTVYGGEYDARTGVLTVTHVLLTITNVDSVGTQSGLYFFRKGLPASQYSVNMTADNLGDYISETYYPALNHGAAGTFFITSLGSSLHLTPTDQTLDTVAKMNTYLADNPAVCLIPLAESLRQTIQLPPCPIDTLEGVNNVWADTGNTSLEAIKIGR